MRIGIVINIEQFRTRVVQPVLQSLAGWNAQMNAPAAENLLVGTAVQESRLTYLAQVGGGPALGVMQIEPNTHDDIWTNYLAYRADLAQVVDSFSAGTSHTAQQLPWNLAYSVAMARLVYWRQPAALPADGTDLEALGAFWKTHYNTQGGAGTAAEWVENYQKYVTAP